MIRKLIALSLLAAAVVALPVAGQAAECNGEITELETPAGLVYVDDRDATGEGGIWVYLESNGLEGLQSGGPSIILEDADYDDCFEVDPVTGEPITPDTLIV